MNVSAWLAELREKDIHVWADDAQIKVNAPDGALTPELRSRLQDNKEGILAFLQSPVELSFAQQRLWFLDQIEMVSTTYVIPRALRLRGPLQVDVLEKAINALVARHESLRTSFPQSETGPVQHVTAVRDEPLPLVDVSDDPGQLDALMCEHLHREFDLAKGPLFRAALYRLGKNEHVLLLMQHHAISDAWSLTVMTRELGVLYDDIVTGRPSTLPELTVQYRDYTRSIREWMQGDILDEQLEYWRAQLEGAPQVLDLPTDRPRPSIESHQGALFAFAIPPETRAGIDEMCRREETTLFMVLLAALDVLLWRYSGQDDLLVGVPVANRDREEIEGLVGLFVNTLIIRNDLSGDPTVSELLDRVRQRCLDAYAHQDLPIEMLVEHMQPARDLSRNPMFQVMLVLENKSQQPTLEISDIDSESFDVDRQASHVDCTIYFEESQEHLRGIFEYATDLFDEETIARMSRHLQSVLAAMVAEPAGRISEISLLDNAERTQVVTTWNATAADYPGDECLHEIIAHRAESVPGKTTVICLDEPLTYAELEQRANRFARALRERNIGRGCHVGICVERSADMLAGVLGILKSGAAYVPLDPSFPSDRLQFMAEDAELALLISTTSLSGSFDLPKDRELLLDRDAAIVEAQSGDVLEPDGTLDARPEDAAYLIYTSGSTGTPKGVVVPHRAVVNFLNSMARRPGLIEEDVLVAVTTLSFDISVLELYLPLVVGARVVIAGRDEAVDGQALIRLLEDNSATVMQATPVTWRLLLDNGWSPGTNFKALVGGEPLPRDLADSLIAAGVELWNMYGPTETTVWSTCAHVQDTSDGISIGTPIDNTTIYVLGERQQLCPTGVPGELYIGGDGVTLGYWRRPELTEDRFIDDPFGQSASGKIYATGDKARWLADGTLEHLGRLDGQVKVRGYRVELGEIETRMSEHPGISEAAARLWSVSTDDVRIVACYVPAEGRRLAIASLRKLLRTKLPEYMIPQYFLPIDEVPLTPNGKVDRRQLPTPATAEDTIGEQEPPANPTEEAIAEIWTRLIQPVRPIGRNDMFFEIGGHSLLALRALTQMEQTLDTSIDFRSLFGENLSEIAALVNEKRMSDGIVTAAGS